MTKERAREVVQSALSSPFAGVPSEHADHRAGAFTFVFDGEHAGECDVLCSCGETVRLGLGHIVNAHRPEDFETKENL